MHHAIMRLLLRRQFHDPMALYNSRSFCFCFFLVVGFWLGAIICPLLVPSGIRMNVSAVNFTVKNKLWGLV